MVKFLADVNNPKNKKGAKIGGNVVLTLNQLQKLEKVNAYNLRQKLQAEGKTQEEIEEAINDANDKMRMSLTDKPQGLESDEHVLSDSKNFEDYDEEAESDESSEEEVESQTITASKIDELDEVEI